MLEPARAGPGRTYEGPPKLRALRKGKILQIPSKWQVFTSDVQKNYFMKLILLFKSVSRTRKTYSRYFIFHEDTNFSKKYAGNYEKIVSHKVLVKAGGPRAVLKQGRFQHCSQADGCTTTVVGSNPTVRITENFEILNI